MKTIEQRAEEYVPNTITAHIFKSSPLKGLIVRILRDAYIAGAKEQQAIDEKVRLKKSDDMCTLLQGMMLLDNKYRDYDFSSISADEVMTYSQYIKNNYPDECKDRLKKIIGFLDNVFYMKDKNLKNNQRLASLNFNRNLINVQEYASTPEHYELVICYA